MKKILFICFFTACFTMEITGQNMMTVREVCNFDINDEFHYNYVSGPCPNAKRVKILDKYYSAANDTVFYARYNDNYTSVPDMSTTPPHLDYFFNTFNDTVFYTDLDSLINYKSSAWPVDSALGNYYTDSLYYSSLFCGKLVYSFTACMGCAFEGHYTYGIYGEGLGCILYRYYVPADGLDSGEKLFYYKKGNTECGTPDTITLSVNEFNTQNRFAIIPNPASASVVVMFNKKLKTKHTIKITDISGRLVKTIESVSGDRITVNTENFQKGVYTVCLLNTGGGVSTGKLVIE